MAVRTVDDDPTDRSFQFDDDILRFGGHYVRFPLAPIVSRLRALRPPPGHSVLLQLGFCDLAGLACPVNGFVDLGGSRKERIDLQDERGRTGVGD